MVEIYPGNVHKRTVFRRRSPGSGAWRHRRRRPARLIGEGVG